MIKTLYQSGQSRGFQVTCIGCIVGIRGHVDLGSKVYMQKMIQRYSDLKGMTSMISYSIFKTSKTCSSSKNWAFLDSNACKCPIDTDSYILWPKVIIFINMYMSYIIFYRMQIRDPVILKENICYIDPIAICESLHVRSRWYKDCMLGQDGIRTTMKY